MGGVGRYVLGLDIGSASLGWACVGLDRGGRPDVLLRAGVRIFEPGVEGSALDIERGKDQSKAVERRGAWLQRRQLRRRTARQRELFRVLQCAQLLPGEADGASSEARHRILTEFDKQIKARFRGGEGASFAELPLYWLRTRALDFALDPHELGRVLFHLSQRRGFQSNRKDPARKAEQEEELGQVKKDIGELAELMRKARARTLGEYFAGLDPHTQRVRRRWTARAMFEHEFAAIWDKQQTFHPNLLTPALREEAARLLFFQRPIAAQSHLVGTCDLEPGRKRAPWASLGAQHFRVLQKVNDLCVQTPAGPAERPLSMEERGRVFALLNREGSRTFVQIKAHLGLPKESRFNLERGDAKSLPGNRTEHSMRKVFGERWDGFTEGKRNQIVENWRGDRTEEEMLAEARQGLALDSAAAELLVREQPQEGYCSLSLAAIAKLMPPMLEGKSFKAAEAEVYGARFAGLPVHDRIPGVREYLPNLRNPAVERALTEVRKVVNALVKEHGKPWEVRIELARDLKKPRAERAKATVNNRKREAENKKLAERMASECGLQNPSRGDMEKAKLWCESEGCCPYTGRRLAFSRLFDDDSGFDVDHLLPRSRHPDDSFQNKVLCWAEANRQQKRNQTPWEAYGRDPDDWAQILARVAKWQNPGKLRKFKIESERELEEFSARQMYDTRYSSVLAARLLESLYGGRDVKEQDGARQVVFASSGAVTATLRRS